MVILMMVSILMVNFMVVVDIYGKIKLFIRGSLENIIWMDRGFGNPIVETTTKDSTIKI